MLVLPLRGNWSEISTCHHPLKPYKRLCTLRLSKDSRTCKVWIVTPSVLPKKKRGSTYNIPSASDSDPNMGRRDTTGNRRGKRNGEEREGKEEKGKGMEFERNAAERGGKDKARE